MMKFCDQVLGKVFDWTCQALTDHQNKGYLLTVLLIRQARHFPNDLFEYLLSFFLKKRCRKTVALQVLIIHMQKLITTNENIDSVSRGDPSCDPCHPQSTVRILTHLDEGCFAAMRRSQQIFKCSCQGRF